MEGRPMYVDGWVVSSGRYYESRTKGRSVDVDG